MPIAITPDQQALQAPLRDWPRMTGALPLLRWGRRPDLLPAVASGELLLTAAIREPSNPQPTPPATTITNGKLTGTKVGVPYAEQAALIVVPSMIMGHSGQIAPRARQKDP